MWSECVWVGRSLGGPSASRPGWFPLPSSLCFHTSLPTPLQAVALGTEHRGSGSIWKVRAGAGRGGLAQSYQLGGLTVPICGKCSACPALWIFPLVCHSLSGPLSLFLSLFLFSFLSLSLNLSPSFFVPCSVCCIHAPPSSHLCLPFLSVSLRVHTHRHAHTQRRTHTHTPLFR